MLNNAKIAEINGPNGEVFDIVFVSAYGDSWKDHGVIDKEKNCTIYHGAIQARQTVSKEKEDLKSLQISFLWVVNRIREVYLKESGKSTTLEQEALLRNICDYSEPESDTIELNKMLIKYMEELVYYIQNFSLFYWGTALEDKRRDMCTENLRSILIKAQRNRNEIEKKRKVDSSSRIKNRALTEIVF